MLSGFEILLPADRPATFTLYSPDQAQQSLVSFARDSHTGTAVAVIGAIYYRDELLAGLRGSTSLASDAEVAHTIFKERVISGIEKIEGEFALVVFDSTARTLVAVRDPLGSWPLYWAKSADGVRIGTSLKALARHLPTKVNLESAARFLMHPFAFTELAGEATMLDPLKRVAPGTRSTIHANGRIEERLFWNWEERIPPTQEGITLEEAATGFAERFQQSVAERVRRGRIACHLSGGMDSSSVTCLARDQLAARGQRLSAISVTSDMPSLSGETKYMEMVARQGGSIDMQYINGDHALDYQWFTPEGIPSHDEPYAAIFRIASERMLIDAASQAGADTILTGAAADDLLVGDRLYLADMVRCGQFVVAFREAGRWANASNISIWSVLRQHILRPLRPTFLCEGWGTLLRGGFGRWPNPGLFAIPPWVQPSFAREHGMWNKGLAVARESNRYPHAKSFRLFWLRTSAGDFSSWYLAGPRGMRNSHPFLDLRVMSWCLSLPRQVKEIPGRLKPILADAMKGVLPEPIRARHLKCNFNDVYWNGLSRSLPALEDMVRRSALSDLGLFDTNALVSAMRQHALGVGDAMVGGRINSSLALIAWHDQIAQGKQPAILDTADSNIREVAPC